MATQPTITVVTATRNRIDLLRRALESIAAQDYRDYEALVLDDGSDHAVQGQYEGLFPSLPGNFALHRLRPPGSAGAGPGAARNAGIRLARGEYIAFLDDDDRWICTDHLSVATSFLRRHDADFFFANMRGERGGKVVLPDWHPGCPSLSDRARLSERPAVYDLPSEELLHILRHFQPHPNCWVVRRKLLEDLGGFWER